MFYERLCVTYNMKKVNPIRIILLFFCLSYSQSSLAVLKQLYLEGLAGGPFMTRTQSTGTSNVTITSGNSITANQVPVFQAPFTITATNITVTLNLQRIAGGIRNARVELFINGTGGTSLGTAQWSWGGWWSAST
jgi:hypothetical protein